MFISNLLFSTLTTTSLKKPDSYNLFRIKLISFSSKNLLSGNSEKTRIVSCEILSFPLIIIFL